MSIVYDPKALLKKMAPKAKVEKLLKGNVSLKKTALSFVNDIDFIDKKSVSDVALKVIKSYKKRIRNAEYGTRGLVKEEITSAPKLLIARVQNEIIYQMHQDIQQKHKGKIGRWLPSDALEPRPEHQANYGKEYVIGEGIDGVEPGDEPGCKCGVEILD